MSVKKQNTYTVYHRSYLAASGGRVMTAASSQTEVGRLPGAGNDALWEEGVDGAEGVDGTGSVPFGRNGSYGSSYGTKDHSRVQCSWL